MVDDLLTRTSEAPGAGRRARVTGPYLYLVLQCERLELLGARCSLADAARVEIGRGAARSWSTKPLHGDGARLDIPDRFLSQRHAEVVHVDGAWRVRDLGSKNGSFIGGTAVTDAALSDGDIVELGHTFFLFRVEPMAVRGRSIVEATSLAGPRGLRTLVPSLEQSFSSLSALASAASPLVILGETGTGKEVIAKAIHELSGRSGAFVGVNCGALPASLVESELFGSKKGAFSGSTEDRVGLIRGADQGTLLLDEIGDLPLEAQTVLLRTLQEGEVRAVGAARAVPVDLRVLAATHHDLEKLVERGRFRADLLARLSGFTVRLPPLRERIADLGLLLIALSQERGSSSEGSDSRFALSVDAARAMLRHNWPMNIRELEQVLRAALVLARASQVPGEPLVISVDHLPRTVRLDRSPRVSPTQHRQKPPPEGFDDRRAAFVTAMVAHRGNVSAIARALGIARMQVHRWIRRYEVDPQDYRTGEKKSDGASEKSDDQRLEQT